MKANQNVLPLYTFPALPWWQAFSSLETCFLEANENWVKQSFRSRYEIAGPNGKQSLSIPTIKKSRIKIKDVRISYDEDWVTNHLRSVKTAYNNSPYYEHYGHQYEAILTREHEYLIDLNINALEFGLERLQIRRKIQMTDAFNVSAEVTEANKKAKQYTQVFDEKNGFIPNLSFIDLLFNCGPESGLIVG